MYLVCTYQFKTLSRLTKKSEVTELLFGKSIIYKWHLTYYWLNKKILYSWSLLLTAQNILFLFFLLNRHRLRLSSWLPFFQESPFPPFDRDLEQGSNRMEKLY